MAVLNMLVSLVLVALGLFSPDGEGSGSGDGSGDGAGSTGTTTPPATGGTPTTGPTAGTPPATPPADGADDDGDGRGSKSAVLADLARERAKRHDLETEVNELRQFRDSQRSEAQKAQDKAIADARAEETARWSGGARAAAWRAALTKAGCLDSEAVAMPSDVQKLKVDAETFTVDGIDDAVKAYKAAHPNLFVATTAGGSADQGPRGSSPRKPASFADAVTQRLAGSGN